MQEPLLVANVHNPPILINHSDLELFSENNHYKKVCPLCSGILGVRGDASDVIDNCMYCGQMFIYFDMNEHNHELGM